MNWQAKWIWDAGEASPRNFYWCARKEFELPSVYTEVTLQITADTRYTLWINGKYLGNGPVRAFAHNWRYDSYDLTPYIRSGKNVVAVLVNHVGHSTFQYLEARGGLLAQVECDGQVIAATDSTWKGLEHPSYERRAPRISCQQGWAERFDARKEPSGWTEPGYDDSAWEPAAVVGPAGCEPWTMLSPRDIPFLTQQPVYPSRIVNSVVVKPPKQVWSMDLKPNLYPGDLTANRAPLPGLVAAVLHCSQPMRVSISTVHNGFSFLAIDGQPLTWKDASEGIELTEGDHLFMVDAGEGRRYHEWFATFVFNYEQGDLSLRSLVKEAAYPFATIGPFSGNETEQHLEARALSSIHALAEHPKIKPVELSHTAANHVFALAVNAIRQAEIEPHIESPDNMLSPNEEVTTIYPSADGDVEFVIDFGRELVGFIEMELDAPEGTVFDFEGFENMQDGKIQWTHALNCDFRYTAREGWQVWRSVVRRGYRFGSLAIRFPEGCVRPVRIRNIKCCLNVYPYTNKGHFDSSDQVLNRAWDISRWTVTLCSEDTFVDCPAYEQTYWVGDARNESLFTYTAYGDYRLARRCLLLAGESLWRSPIVESQVPSGWQELLPAWSLLWTVACEEYYRFSGDLDFLREVYPAVRQQNINIFENYICDDGLFRIAAWSLLDWAPMDTPREGAITHQNMWLVETLRRSARMAEVLGHREDASGWLKAAESLRDAINKHLWDEEKQGYIDCIRIDGTRSNVFSQQTQTVAYLCDIIPESRRELFERYLTEVPDGWVQVGSPFMMAFTIEALEKAGDRGRILELIRKWWGLMIENDATTCWETFPEALTKDWNTRSYCHAWSAAPAFALPAYVLGVKPIEPGFKRFEVKPFLGNLRFARGIVPTPHGDIQVELQQKDTGIVMSLAVPKGTCATVKGSSYPAGKHEIIIA